MSEAGKKLIEAMKNAVEGKFSRVYLYPGQLERLGPEPYGPSVEHWLYNPETGEFERMAKEGKD